MATFQNLTKQLAQLDMERAKVLKELREKPEFVLKFIQEKIALMVGKFYATPNADLIYKVKAGIVKTVPKESYVNEGPHGTIKRVPVKGHDYVCELEITKYGIAGDVFETVYRISSPEMPKDVTKWLEMGNAEISVGKARDYMTKALHAEKKKLADEKKKIDDRIKEINKQLV